MENSKRNWKLSEKAKNPRSQWEIAAGKLKTFWKQQKLFCFFSKNRLLACRIPKSGRNSGHQGGKTARKWLDYTVKPCLKIGWRNRQFSAIQQKRLWHLFYHSLMCECDKKDTLFWKWKINDAEKFYCFLLLKGHCSIHSRYSAPVIFLVLNFSFWLYHSFNNFSTSSKLSKSRIVSIGTLPPQPCSQSYQIIKRIMSSGVSALVKKFSSLLIFCER